MPDSSDTAQDPDRAAIERACRALADGFSVASDRGLHDSFAALFTEDGRFSRPGLEVTGRDKLGEMVRARPADQLIRHIGGSLVVETLDDAHARGLGSQAVYRRDRATGVSEPVILVDYVDHYVRTGEGWRISSREVSLSF